MGRPFKLVWTDNGQTKTAMGTGYDLLTSSNPHMVVFHGNERDIVLTANTFGGNWIIV